MDPILETTETCYDKAERREARQARRDELEREYERAKANQDYHTAAKAESEMRKLGAV